jgi:hypothetical protein
MIHALVVLIHEQANPSGDPIRPKLHSCKAATGCALKLRAKRFDEKSAFGGAAVRKN